MHYYSTGGSASRYGIRDVIVRGLAPDGGLFMPERIPLLPRSIRERPEQHEFQDLAYAAARPYLPALPANEVRRIIRTSCSFPVPLRTLAPNLHVLELFHGPTLAFKDFGARFLARTMSTLLPAGQRLGIVVATSGDTGSAVASGFLGVPKIGVYILYPKGRVSALQEKQLTTFGRTITAFAVAGRFDDCQAMAKAALRIGVSSSGTPLSSANSINFGRLLAQTFYYLEAVAALRRQGEYRPPVVVVPSGNFGNLVAGVLMKRMGAPIGHFVAATNRNRIVPEFLETGVFRPRQSRQTISNAMDVGSPSNFARLHTLYGRSRRAMAREITGIAITDAETKRTMAATYRRYAYAVDPHTAVGLAAAARYRRQHGDDRPLIVLGTAHPAKFLSLVEAVLGKRVPVPPRLQAVLHKKKHAVPLPYDVRALLQLIH